MPSRTSSTRSWPSLDRNPAATLYHTYAHRPERLPSIARASATSDCGRDPATEPHRCTSARISRPRRTALLKQQTRLDRSHRPVAGNRSDGRGACARPRPAVIASSTETAADGHRAREPARITTSARRGSTRPSGSTSTADIRTSAPPPGSTVTPCRRGRTGSRPWRPPAGGSDRHGSAANSLVPTMHRGRASPCLSARRSGQTAARAYLRARHGQRSRGRQRGCRARTSRSSMSAEIHGHPLWRDCLARPARHAPAGRAHAPARPSGRTANESPSAIWPPEPRVPVTTAPKPLHVNVLVISGSGPLTGRCRHGDRAGRDY